MLVERFDFLKIHFFMRNSATTEIPRYWKVPVAQYQHYILAAGLEALVRPMCRGLRFARCTLGKTLIKSKKDWQNPICTVLQYFVSLPLLCGDSSSHSLLLVDYGSGHITPRYYYLHKEPYKIKTYTDC